MIKGVCILACDNCGTEAQVVFEDYLNAVEYMDAREKGWAKGPEGMHLCPCCFEYGFDGRPGVPEQLPRWNHENRKTGENG
jgi:hypothetical protein